MNLSSTLPLAFTALLIEAAAGYPPWLFGLLGHPVTWMGSWLAWLERELNRANWGFVQRRTAGTLAFLLLLAAVAVATVPLGLTVQKPLDFAVVALLAASLPAQRSLYQHVSSVAEALERDGLEAGRQAVSQIVGRNPAFLDEAGVARAAIESLAENFADGVVAPAFWIALGGLPGGALYKAVNTADSMIGHRNARYAAFGWAAARFDDLVNLPASRLAAAWLIVAALVTGRDHRAAIEAVGRDARKHRSPNAGWPEAAMAGALGLKLAGPRVYGETLVVDANMGHGRREVTAADIRNALGLYRASCGIQIVVLAMLAGISLRLA